MAKVRILVPHDRTVKRVWANGFEARHMTTSDYPGFDWSIETWETQTPSDNPLVIEFNEKRF